GIDDVKVDDTAFRRPFAHLRQGLADRLLGGEAREVAPDVLRDKVREVGWRYRRGHDTSFTRRQEKFLAKAPRRGESTQGKGPMLGFTSWRLGAFARNLLDVYVGQVNGNRHYSSFPLRNWTTRWAYWAAARSCVTRSTVLPERAVSAR